MFKKLFFLIFFLLPAIVSAADLPFTDVPASFSWYNDLRNMYDAGVVGDTPDHLFHPDGPLLRDEFVGIVV